MVFGGIAKPILLVFGLKTGRKCGQNFLLVYINLQSRAEQKTAKFEKKQPVVFVFCEHLYLFNR